MRGGQYQRVKAFGDKPRLMARKSEETLIYTGPLARRGKAVCYTKETPNLLRDTLNIPLLLGTGMRAPSVRLSVCPFYGCNSKQSAGLHLISLLVFTEYEGKRELWVGGLAARWEEALVWSQCGMVSTKLEQVSWWVLGGDFRIRHWHRIADTNPTEEILISLWLWKFFLFEVASSSLQNDWFLFMSTGPFFFSKTLPFVFLLWLEGIYR